MGVARLILKVRAQNVAAAAARRVMSFWMGVALLILKVRAQNQNVAAAPPQRAAAASVAIDFYLAVRGHRLSAADEACRWVVESAERTSHAPRANDQRCAREHNRGSGCHARVFLFGG